MPHHEPLKEEIDFKELARKPGKLFGYLYGYFLAVLVLLGLLYIWNLSATGKNEVTPAALADSSAFRRDIPFQSPREIPPVDVMTAGKPSPEAVERARGLYSANCASCHGETGLGDGPAGLVMNPKPRNFHASEGWTNGRKASEIYKTLEEGIVKNGMASFNYIPPADRFALAHLVRTFMLNPPADSSDDLMALEASYQLSKGTSTAGTIPVKKATRLLVAENGPAMERLAAAEALFADKQDDPGAMLLRSVVKDERRALYCLVVNSLPEGNVDDLVKTLCTDPQSMGFSGSVAQLTSEDWSALYQFVERLKAELDQRVRGRG